MTDVQWTEIGMESIVQQYIINGEVDRWWVYELLWALVHVVILKISWEIVAARWDTEME